MKPLVLVILTLNIPNSAVFGFAPLGSDPVDKCNIYKYECPSHYICETHDRIVRESSHGHCICDRFYGFYGPTCEKVSVTSYMLGGICAFEILLAIRALYLNMEFVHQHHERDSLQQDTLCRCLFFNVLMVFPSFAWPLGFFVGVTSIDGQMFFHEYIRYAVYVSLIVSLVLSTMSISLAWIETVEKTRAIPNSHWKYVSILYGTSVFALLVSFVSFRYSLTDVVGVLEGIAISFSYFQAGRMVTEALSVMQENGDIIIYQGGADVLYTIKQTSKKMVMYSLFLAFSFLIAGFTMTMFIPKYKEQNHLPRYTQGQLCLLVIGINFYQINITLLDYLKSCAKRQLARPPVNRTYAQSLKDFCAWLCCCPQRMTIHELHERVVELPESSSGLSSSQLEHSNESSSDDGSKSSKFSKTLKSDNAGRLSAIISNDNSSKARADEHINCFMKWGFPQMAAVSGQKRGSQKVEVVLGGMLNESSMVSSLTEPSCGSELGQELGLRSVDIENGDGFHDFNGEVPAKIIQEYHQQFPNHKEGMSISSDVSSITSSSSDTPPAVVPRFYSNRLPKLSPLPTPINLPMQLQQPSATSATSEELLTVDGAYPSLHANRRFRDRLLNSE